MAGYVEGLSFVGIEAAEVEADLHFVVYLSFCTQGGEGGKELIFLLTFVIDIEAFCILSSEGLTQRIRREAVVIHAHVPQERHLPRGGKFPCDEGLIIKEGRLVITRRSQSSEHVFAGLVTYAVHLAVGAVSVSDIDLCAQETRAQTRFEGLRTFVGDIQHGGHLVAVLRAVTACRERDILHHLRIDETESFLLSGADEQRPAHFDTVHIDRVLVKRTAADVVLRT